jgi:hypothetical protein
MRSLLPLLAITAFVSAGCDMTVRSNDPPAKAKHTDGPGNSENAPGQQKKK